MLTNLHLQAKEEELRIDMLKQSKKLKNRISWNCNGRLRKRRYMMTIIKRKLRRILKKNFKNSSSISSKNNLKI